MSHLSGHLLALEYLARIGAGAVGTSMTVELGTVSHGSSVLSVSLDGALEALTFGDGRHINLVACGEDVCLNLLRQSVAFRILELQLSDVSLIGNAGLVKMAFERLVNQFLSLVYEANLYRAVSVVLHGLNLRNHTGSGLKYGNRCQYAVFVENLCHSNFGS